MKRVFGMVLGLALISACVRGTATTCDATELTHLIGQNISVLQTMRFGTTLRVIGPDTAVTEDYSPGRLNIIHNQNDLITNIGCY